MKQSWKVRESQGDLLSQAPEVIDKWLAHNIMETRNYNGESLSLPFFRLALNTCTEGLQHLLLSASVVANYNCKNLFLPYSMLR